MHATSTIMNLRAIGRFCVILLWMSNWAETLVAASTETNRLEFGVFWPPRAPSDTPPQSARPLLNGSLLVHTEPVSEGNLVAQVRITLSRSADDTSREFWNLQLAFPEYDWMRYVRVWDRDNRWLWPNLPFLLRLHGTERVERYGGVDPGKGVDNDFAAVLIRKYDESGTHEDQATKRTPLVAAEWKPLGVSGPADKQAIVHAAESDKFALHLKAAEGQGRGMAVVWLVYADFMGARLPEAWPKEPEYAGGILAYFEVHWDLNAEPGRQVTLLQLVPKRSTGFDWKAWATRTRATRDSLGTAQLSDLPNPSLR
jgi:hypothetical protein